MAKGGKRIGSGRPKTSEPRVRLSVRVRPNTKKYITDSGINAGRLLDDYIEQLDESEPQK